jgi:hypothetical protein
MLSGGRIVAAVALAAEAQDVRQTLRGWRWASSGM